MSAPPSPPATAVVSEQDVHAAVQRLAAIEPGPYWVVTCYLKLEPRDRTRGKYLIKMNNRVKEAAEGLARQSLGHADREAIAADLQRVRDYLEEPNHLPHTRAIAIFASQGLDLFEALTLARFFEVTAYDCVELTALPALDASRASKFHGSHQRQVMARAGTPSGSAGEHNYHMRIRTEKQRFYAHIADRIFHIHRLRPLAGLLVGGIGADAGAVIPHLHSYLHDLVMGVVKLNPKTTTKAEVREAALTLREERERAWERAHAEALKDGVPEGWAVNGVDPTLKALSRGQVRTLLADGQDDDPRIDEAVEEALRQRSQVDVLYDEKARRVVQGLAALLRFRRG